MLNLKEVLQEAKSVAILGHIRPDGDCIGSCLSLYNYIETYFPNIEAKVYLQDFMPEFLMLKNADKIEHDYSEDKVYDVCFSLDSADKARHGEYVKYLDTAKKTIGIDHHISNQGFAEEHLIISDASATAEIMSELIGKENLTRDIAECLYLGIAHDTGVFQYSNASPKTFRVVADLLETGIEASRIIDETFYQKSYVQNQILGRTLMESIMLMDDKVIVGAVKLKDMEFYGVTPKALDGIVSQLRYTRGVEVAIFLYELEPQRYKISMRSNGKVDVSKVAGYFGGGGHVKAAGCEMSGNFYDVVNNLTLHIEAQLQENE
ncbi:MAG: bifunctional oligoribonuclease/PAP phosphatase NrnA [Lachnospiraceae bacterium]|nr:bifunctional oligoribonuclease/PAP phosphatase NrnA [Lachnospiraceae bacterium]